MSATLSLFSKLEMLAAKVADMCQVCAIGAGAVVSGDWGAECA